MNFEVLRHKYYKRYLEVVGGSERKKGFLFHLRKQHTQTVTNAQNSGEIFFS